MAELSRVLGYPVSLEALSGRLQSRLRRNTELVLVAELTGGKLTDGKTIGWVHGSEQGFLQSGRRCEILGLVVETSHRGKGVGRALVAAVERWARDRGLEQIGVRSAAQRVEAHPFYERLGYVCTKTQRVYRKQLGAYS